MTEACLHHLCEGKVVVYKRANSRTKFWYVRVKLDHTNKWKKFSAKTDNIDKAMEFAITQYHVRQELKKNNIEIDSKRFSYVADYVIKQLEADIAAGSGKPTYVDYIRAIKRYKEFFGKKLITSITYQDLVEFDAERTRKLGRKAKQSTVNLTNTALQRVFNTAVKKGWLHGSQVVTFQNDGRRGERRPYFELHEYEKLYRFMRGYVKLTTKDSPQGGVKEQTIMIRELLRDYVLFLANTGLRHGTETKNLRWRHISEQVINGEKYIVIKLQKGKTGKRTIVCRHGVRRYLERIKSRFPHIANRTLNQMLDIDEPVFRLCDGTVPKDWHGAFRIMLEKAKLLYDVNGSRRSLYSLRHTYATFQILYSKIDLHTLAKNMGTSIAMLERHYSHLEVLHRADILAGRPERVKPARKAETKEPLPEKQTDIVLVEGDIQQATAAIKEAQAAVSKIGQPRLGAVPCDKAPAKAS
jgi:integrase